ncbi:acid protease [Annulohypoxylon maeteangense]|uniref:acid protease n=1 Tax=Annulohypoxylon maeteangense TaxID=1927788 RepID=UPI00200892D0|nr:acid protease [Annulohypoxylon maeteangense]KAI0880570.1 acid protease [Annulohypoxylon maeteangense]
MQSLAQLLLVFGLVALASSSPTGIQKRGVYKVERVANPNFTGRNGPRALLKTLRKYRMPIPASVASAAQQDEMITKRQNRKKGKGRKGKGAGAAGAAAGAGAAAAAKGSAANGTGLVTNTPEANDVEYLSPVNIGGQTLNLDFDSGSSDLWVFNTQLSKTATQGHQVYDPTQSKTFALMQGASFQISYGDGSGAAGNVGTDTVNIGGATVTNQAIEMATAVSSSFVKDTANNGLLGLAFSQLNTVQPAQQKTFFDNVKSSLAEPLFTADLRPQAAGAYEFGRVDTSKFTGAMTWVPVNTTAGFWQFTSQSFAVNGGTPQTSTAGAQAIADTGTTLLLADAAVAKGYYAQVQGAVNDQQQGGFTFPCDATLPDLQLDVGGTMATVKGADIKFAQVDAQTCFGGLQATTAGLQVYGDIFFKSNFIAFNGGNNTLGFAAHA